MHKTAPNQLPATVATFDEIPRRLRPLYDSGPDEGYILTPAGKALASYRNALAREPHQEPVAPLRTLTKTEFMILVGVAEPGPEREHFLKSAALRRIKVEG
jgi:hypothetical protein